MSRPAEYPIYIENQISVTIIQVSSKNDIPAIELPIAPIQIWNNYENISYPPVFNSITDGCISEDGLTRLNINKKLTKIGENIYTVNSELTNVLYDKNIIDYTTTVENVTKGIQPTGYNPILVDSNGIIHYYNPLKWIINLSTGIIKFKDIVNTGSYYITYIQYIGNTGGSTNTTVGPTGPSSIGYTGPSGIKHTGPSGIGLTGPSNFIVYDGTTGPTGPVSIGITGPVSIGYTGPSYTGPCISHTGPLGFLNSVSSPTGPTGPTGQMSIGPTGQPSFSIGPTGFAGPIGNSLPGHTGPSAGVFELNDFTDFIQDAKGNIIYDPRYSTLLPNAMGVSNIVLGPTLIDGTDNIIGNNNIYIRTNGLPLSFDNNVVLYSNINNISNISNFYDNVMSYYNVLSGDIVNNFYQNTILDFSSSMNPVNLTKSVSFGSFNRIDNLTNVIELGGKGASVSNSIVLSDNPAIPIYCAVAAITSLSDIRDKKNIIELKNCTELVTKIKPVTYIENFRTNISSSVQSAQSAQSAQRKIGFIAQNLIDVEKKSNYDGYLKLGIDSDPDRYYINTSNILPLLVQTLKELIIKNDKIKKIIKDIKNQ